MKKEKKFRVGFVQNNPKLLRVRENIEDAFNLIGNNRADLWVMPEFFACGYNFKNKNEVKKVAEEIPSGYTVQKLQNLSRKKNCAIVAGLVEKSGKSFFNSCVLVFQGKTHVYRKTHLFANEKKLFSPGNTGFKVVKVNGFSVGMMICFDWYFPESARTLALKGAQVIAHPSNLVLPWGPEGMKIRSLENRVFSVTANRVGKERGLTYIGNSQIVSPKGELLVRAGNKKESVHCINIFPNLSLQKNITPQNHALRDRRKKYYL